MHHRALLTALLVALSPFAAGAEVYERYIPVDSTYSIVAVDPETGQLGMGVQSKALSVGNRTITAKGGRAVVAHQSSSNPMNGALIIDAIERGMTPEEALEHAMRADSQPERRQVAVIDIEGRSATWTSPTITNWAGDRCTPTYCVQGNTLAGPEVIEAMAAAFEATEGPLADRLLAALDAGQAAGGDWRGMQGAALVVVEPLARAGFDDTYIDIRVDDHSTPLVELRRVYDVFRAQEMMRGGVNPAMAAGDLEAAKEAAVAAHEMAPTYDLPLVALAEIAMIDGDMDAAFSRLEQALAVNPWVREQVARDDAFAELLEDSRFVSLLATE